MQIGYQMQMYYLVKTQDAFLKSKTNRLFKDDSIRLIKVVGSQRIIPSEPSLIIQSQIDGVKYQIDLNDFVAITDVEAKFEVYLN